MRAVVLGLLDLPRRFMRGEVAIETCAHAGFFAARDPRCQVCETRMECEWLAGNDEFAALSEKPLDALVDAFESAVLYVDASIAHAGHDRRTCVCELCRWLRQAQPVLAQCEAARAARQGE